MLKSSSSGGACKVAILFGKHDSTYIEVLMSFSEKFFIFSSSVRKQRERLFKQGIQGKSIVGSVTSLSTARLLFKAVDVTGFLDDAQNQSEVTKKETFVS